MVQPMNGRLGEAIVDVDQPHQERGHPATCWAASQRVKPSSTWGRSCRTVATIGAHWPQRRSDCAMAVTAWGTPAVAAEVIAQLVQRHGTHLTDGVRIHRPVSGVRNRRKGAGGPERSRDLPPLPPSGGQMKRRLGRGREKYRSTNSGPAARAWPPLPPSQPRIVVAIAVRARSPGAKPDGRMGCKISGTDCEWNAQTTLRSPDARSKKIRIRLLGADPR